MNNLEQCPKCGEWKLKEKQVATVIYFGPVANEVFEYDVMRCKCYYYGLEAAQIKRTFGELADR